MQTRLLITFQVLAFTMALFTAGQTCATLGEVDKDLTFVPIPPCRILDTRKAGGILLANTNRSFDVTAVANYDFQGGTPTNCNGLGAAGSIAAVAINFTVLYPATNGILLAYPYLGTPPTGNTLSYMAGVVTSGTSVVKLDQGASANEMTIFSKSTTHLTGDIVGYYSAPQATALQCVNTPNTTANVPAGGTANAVAPACPTGYTQTGTNCETTSWVTPLVFASSGTCSAKNNDGSSQSIRASRTCCRVPGG